MPKATKLPSGNWRVQASKVIDGQKVMKSFTDPDRKKALAKASQWYAENNNTDIESITLKIAYERYIDNKSKVLSPGTIREYTRQSKRYLQTLMPLKISTISNEQIQRAINIEATDKSPKTIRDIIGLLSGVMKMFRPDFKITVTLPKKEKPKFYIPTEDEVRKVIEESEGTEMELPILLAAFGPMRRGEICALTDKDIDGCKVTINKALAQNEKKEWVVKAPKTTAGFRTIYYPDFMKEKLSSVNGKVFAHTPNAITSRFEHICSRAGVRQFKFHALRHYCVSYLHSKGVPTKYIMARGGWETETVINQIYNHTLNDATIEINKIINDNLSDIITKSSHENSHDI